MNIRSLSISSFRNLTELSISFADGINILIGGNGSGKTNLLEAVFTVCLGRSQRRATDTVLLKNGAQVYRLEGEVELTGRMQRVGVAFENGGRKKITVDSSPVRIGELYSRFCAVSLGPEDSDILSGTPSIRRHFLNLHLAQLSTRYLSDLNDYQKALNQKNAALKKEMDPSPFDQALVSYGSRIVLTRSEFTAALARLSVPSYQDITDGEILDIIYRPSISTDSKASIDEIEAAFWVKMEENASRELVLKTALTGPHRDDIEFRIGNLPARTHGSQGQRRTAAIALKLAVYDLLRERRKTTPVLLLDEIFAELDHDRVGRLVHLLAEQSQIFLTSTHEPVCDILSQARRFQVDNGRIKEVS